MPYDLNNYNAYGADYYFGNQENLNDVNGEYYDNYEENNNDYDFSEYYDVNQEYAETGNDDYDFSGYNYFGKEDEDIVNGIELPRGYFPAMVQIKYNGNHWCGGSILSGCWVLTAGHCVYGKTAANFEVIAGEHDTTKTEGSEQIRRGTWVKAHPNYNSATLANDVGLIYVCGSPFTYTSFIQPTQLASTGADYYNEWLYAIGWGQTTAGTSSTVLQYTPVYQHTEQSCKNDFAANGAPFYYYTHANSICVEGQGVQQNACHGDSGGPLWSIAGGVKKQVGLTSWGKSGCGGDAPAVYVRPYAYRSWIDGYVNAYGTKIPAKWI